MDNKKEDTKKEALKDTDQNHGLQDDHEELSDLDTGWAWAVLFASFGTFFLIGNSMYAVGIIHSSLLERYGQKVALTSWAGALHTALMSLGGMFFVFLTHQTFIKTIKLVCIIFSK